jgi:phosphoribosylanthranilate isomerase
VATWVKICGVTRLEDARAAFDSGADAIGINFWPGSRRYCEPARARDLVAALRPNELVYGVFVDEARERIEEIVREVGLGGVQLHGREPASAAEGWGIPVIRAVAAVSREFVLEALECAARLHGREPAKAGTGTDFRGQLSSQDPNGIAGNRTKSPAGVVANRSQSPHVPSVQRILVDNAAGGGSGKVVDGALLDGIDFAEAILAGGLTPANVAATVARLHPFGVDTAGGVESAPGIKDARLIDEFVRAARMNEQTGTR